MIALDTLFGNFAKASRRIIAVDLRVYGSARTHVDFLRILSLYREGRLLLDELVSKRLPLEQVNSAFESLAQGDVARSVLVME